MVHGPTQVVPCREQLHKSRLLPTRALPRLHTDPAKRALAERARSGLLVRMVERTKSASPTIRGTVGSAGMSRASVCILTPESTPRHASSQPHWHRIPERGLGMLTRSAFPITHRTIGFAHKAMPASVCISTPLRRPLRGVSQPPWQPIGASRRSALLSGRLNLVVLVSSRCGTDNARAMGHKGGPSATLCKRGHRGPLRTRPIGGTPRKPGAVIADPMASLILGGLDCDTKAWGWIATTT